MIAPRRSSLTERRLEVRFGQASLETRRALGWSQRDLARKCGLSQTLIWRVETASAPLSVNVMARIADALGLEVELSIRLPFIAGRPQRDAAHARCMDYVQRRLEAAEWLVEREVEIVHGRSHGWIDLLGFDPRTRTLLIVEIKTEIEDLGRIERSLAWYGREAWASAKRLGWRPARTATWLLVLATDVNDDRIRANREGLAAAFPGRATEAHAALSRQAACPPRALALIDPRSRRKQWLIRCRVDGRRSLAPYPNYAGFMRRAS
ncbi:MAG: helix-turn-helix domain-containing protein [Chloroflexota bacterium]